MSNIIQDVTARLVINPTTRAITPKYRGVKSVHLAKGDHNSVVISFEVSRYVDGNDLKNSVIHIHYANIDEKTKAQSLGMSDATNILDGQSEATGEEIVTFDWIVPNIATRYAGVVSIGVTFERYEDIDGDIQEVYSWSTAPFGKTIVHDSMDYSLEVAEKEIDYLVATCNAIVKAAIDRDFTNKIKNLVDEAVDEAKASGEFKPQKGVDYWTEEDKQELVNDVLQALPRAEGVGF